jgi:hypothetical protein
VQRAIDPTEEDDCAVGGPYGRADRFAYRDDTVVDEDGDGGPKVDHRELSLRSAARRGRDETGEEPSIGREGSAGQEAAMADGRIDDMVGTAGSVREMQRALAVDVHPVPDSQATESSWVRMAKFEFPIGAPTELVFVCQTWISRFDPTTTMPAWT